eukprot:624557-Pelagomonas_calceolata.AAC.3
MSSVSPHDIVLAAFLHSPQHMCSTLPNSSSPFYSDRVAGLLEANGVYNVKLLVNRVRPEMIQKNDMMSVKDVQEMLGIPLLGAIPEDPQRDEKKHASSASKLKSPHGTTILAVGYIIPATQGHQQSQPSLTDAQEPVWLTL